MKIEKVITTMQDMDVDISEVTLLSRDEYENYMDNISKIDQWWWLRSPGSLHDYASYVDPDGSVLYDGVDYVGGCVRPALKISNPKSANLQIGDRFFVAGYSWTVIGEGVALCDQCVGQTAFRAGWRANDANDYEASDVKKWLERWCAENGIVA